MYYIGTVECDPNYLAHYGKKGQKHGIRNYQNKDGSLTPLGREHYGVGPPREDSGRYPSAAERGTYRPRKYYNDDGSLNEAGISKLNQKVAKLQAYKDRETAKIDKIFQKRTKDAREALEMHKKHVEDLANRDRSDYTDFDKEREYQEGKELLDKISVANAHIDYEKTLHRIAKQKIDNIESVGADRMERAGRAVMKALPYIAGMGVSIGIGALTGMGNFGVRAAANGMTTTALGLLNPNKSYKGRVTAKDERDAMGYVGKKWKKDNARWQEQLDQTYHPPEPRYEGGYYDPEKKEYVHHIRL